MLGVYASAAAILVASFVLGRALLHLVGLSVHTWLGGVVGFAVLTIACPLLIRLPGRGVTVAVLLGLITIAAMLYLWREDRGGRLPARRASAAGQRTGGDHPTLAAPGEGEPQSNWALGTLVALIILVAASLPFAFNERDGVLGEGIYTNDQAAQLYWTDWLQHGIGPEPNAVRFGYPTGPQSVAATVAEATNTSLLDSFNGLLLAIPVLTALTALGVMGALSPARRVVAASLTALPFLAASFLAQSAFKETAMALLVLASAVTLRDLAFLNRNPDYGGGAHPRRALIVVLALLVAASVFVYSIPGLVWFALGLPIWLALELLTGGLRVDLEAARSTMRRHRRAIIVGGVIIVAVAAFSASQLSGFVDKVGMVQASAGRLSSPVFPGEALGIWPEGDFRVVRGDVAGAYPAVALGLLAAAIGALAALRRRDWGLIAMGASTVIVYVGARLFASIYVEAKALAVMSPLVVMAVMLALLSPSWAPDGSREPAAAGDTDPADGEGRLPASRLTIARYALGSIVAIALAASTFLALRAAPVGFDQRGAELEHLTGLIPNDSVVFFGVDRFSGYWLRGTLMKSPGGYVPSEVKPRPKKPWDQGLSMDFDTLPPTRLDDFDYAITTRAGYQSTRPPNFKQVARTTSFVLWKRTGPTPPLQIIDKDSTPGRVLACPKGTGHGLAGRPGTATVLDRPVVRQQKAWSPSWHFDAPETATVRMRLPRGRWDVSLQYDSQVPLVVSGGGRSFTLPPSLDGMYLSEQGKASFWRAGALRSKGGPATVTVRAEQPTSFQRLVGVRRQVWLGAVAATRGGSASVPLHGACDRYVDHYIVHGPTAARRAANKAASSSG
jgi:hypothetical protein